MTSSERGSFLFLRTVTFPCNSSPIKEKETENYTAKATFPEREDSEVPQLSCASKRRASRKQTLPPVSWKDGSKTEIPDADELLRAAEMMCVKPRRFDGC